MVYTVQARPGAWARPRRGAFAAYSEPSTSPNNHPPIISLSRSKPLPTRLPLPPTSSLFPGMPRAPAVLRPGARSCVRLALARFNSIDALAAFLERSQRPCLSRMLEHSIAPSRAWVRSGFLGASGEVERESRRAMSHCRAGAPGAACGGLPCSGSAVAGARVPTHSLGILLTVYPPRSARHATRPHHAPGRPLVGPLVGRAFKLWTGSG
jgi:hypothetical protein